MKPDFAKYTEASLHTRAIFACYDPDYESGSLDEAYLDVTAYCERMGMDGGQVCSSRPVMHQRIWSSGMRHGHLWGAGGWLVPCTWHGLHAA